MLKNLSEDANEEVTSASDIKLAKSVLKEATVDNSVIVKVERNPARVKVSSFMSGR